MKMIGLLLGATALMPVTAFAQVVEPAPVAVESGDDFDDIVVTARKTEEKLQNAPTSVSVATAATIERMGLSNLTDIAKTTPGLVFDDTFGRDQNRPVIRGQANILGTSGVAFFIDGIYYSGSLADYDVETISRIEVVKGPQSALYGRNTYSGAINLISKTPSDQWEGRAKADISERQRYELSASVRGPLANGLGISLGGRFYDNKGEFRNAYDGSRLGKQQTYSGFGMLQYDDGGPFRASLRANYNATNDGAFALFNQSADANNCYRDNGALYRGKNRYYCGVVRAPKELSSDYRRQFVDPENVGLRSNTLNSGLRMDLDITDKFTLTSLTGYNNRTADTKTDGDYSGNSYQTVIFAYGAIGPVAGATAPRNMRYTAFASSVQDFTYSNRQDTKDWSQEVRLAYDNGPLHLLAGAYYFDQTDNLRDTRVVPAGALALAQANANLATSALCAALPNCGAFVPITVTAANLPNSRNTNNLSITNKAVFASVTFDLAEGLSLSAEGRYAEEKITQATQTFNEGMAVPTPKVVTATFKEFTPRFTLGWQMTPSNLLYAVYAEGQKPGGFNNNQAIVAGFPTYNPEDNKTYEIGAKNSFLGGKLIANIAVYHTKIAGYQITQNISVPPNQVSLTRNGGDARVNGAELELMMRPHRNFTVTANYAYADAKFTAGNDENLGLIYDVADDGLVNCSKGDQFPAVAGCQSLYGSIVGKQVPRAPQHTVFVDADFRTPIGNGGWSFFTGANVSLTSSSFAQVLNFAETGGSVIVDGRIGIQNRNFKIQAYVKNLTNDNSISQLVRFADANSDLRRSFLGGLRPGRRLGIVGSVEF